jgi:hypothetical protein
MDVVNRASGWKNRAAHGIMVTHGIMPHGTACNKNEGAG